MQGRAPLIFAPFALLLTTRCASSSTTTAAEPGRQGWPRRGCQDDNARSLPLLPLLFFLCWCCWRRPGAATATPLLVLLVLSFECKHEMLLLGGRFSGGSGGSGRRCGRTTSSSRRATTSTSFLVLLTRRPLARPRPPTPRRRLLRGFDLRVRRRPGAHLLCRAHNGGPHVRVGRHLDWRLAIPALCSHVSSPLDQVDSHGGVPTSSREVQGCGPLFVARVGAGT
jgi:hypothetical protein